MTFSTGGFSKWVRSTKIGHEQIDTPDQLVNWICSKLLPTERLSAVQGRKLDDDSRCSSRMTLATLEDLVDVQVNVVLAELRVQAVLQRAHLLLDRLDLAHVRLEVQLQIVLLLLDPLLRFLVGEIREDLADQQLNLAFALLVVLHHLQLDLLDDVLDVLQFVLDRVRVVGQVKQLALQTSEAVDLLLVFERDHDVAAGRADRCGGGHCWRSTGGAGEVNGNSRLAGS